MKNSLLFDKNVVLSLILGREDEERITQILSQFDQLFITTNTFVTCFYVLRKSKMSKEQIYQDLTKFEILEIDKTDCYQSYNLAQNIDDIEDCLELFTAKRNNCQVLSADQKMILKYSGFFEIIKHTNLWVHE